MELPVRLILCQLHNVSARLQLLRSSEGSICLPVPLPKLSEIQDDAPAKKRVPVHPSIYLNHIEEITGFSRSDLAIEHDFIIHVDVPGQPIDVYLVRNHSKFTNKAPKGFNWIELPDCFQLIPLERELFRKIYKHFLE